MNSELQNSNSELTLWELCLICFRAIGRFFIGLYHWFLRVLRLSLQCWYIVLPFVILLGAGGLYFSRLDNRIYKVGAMVRLNGATVSDVDQAYKALVFATHEEINQSQSLLQMLDIDIEQAKGLKHFRTFPVIDFKNDSIADAVDFRLKHNIADTVNVLMSNYLYLEFRTKRPQDAQAIGAAVVNYLNAQPELQRHYQAERAILERESQFCHAQIERLDSFTTAFYFEQGGHNQVQYNRWSSALVVGEREVTLLHPEIIRLIRDTKRVDYELAQATAPVVPVSKFVLHPKALNNRLGCLIVGCLLGYLLGCLAAYTWKRRKDLCEWVRSDA